LSGANFIDTENFQQSLPFYKICLTEQHVIVCKENVT